MLSEAEVAGGSMTFCSIRGGELSGGGPKYSTAGLKEVLLFFCGRDGVAEIQWGVTGTDADKRRVWVDPRRRRRRGHEGQR